MAFARKLFWIIAALAAAILLAPTLASAHDGRHHRAQAAAHTPAHQASAHHHATAHRGSATIDAHVAPDAAKLLKSQPAQLAAQAFGLGFDASSGVSDHNCPTGCCAGAACCAFATLASAIPQIAPPETVGSTAIPTSRDRPSAGASSLLEPPRSIA